MKYQYLRIEKVKGDGTFSLNDSTLLEGSKDEAGTYVTVGVVKFYLQPDMLVALPERTHPSHE